MEADLSQSWLPLLRQLTTASGNQGVWKNVEAGLTGRGDVDFIAPRSEWPDIETIMRGWAAEMDLGPLIVCRHMPDTAFFVAVDRSASRFLQLDVKERATFRGATVFQAPDLLDLMEIDSRGFRRLRQGAEGLIKLVVSGTGHGGRAKPKALTKERVVELLASDAPGKEAAAASVFGHRRGLVLAGAEAALAGGWNRSAMARIEAWFAAKALTEPLTLWGRLRAKQIKGRCEVIRTSLYNSRRIAGSVDVWLEEVARNHSVLFEPRGNG